MRLVRIYSASRLRKSWRTVVALALFAGLCGGAVLALAAGGRRAETAYPRFVARYRGADGEVYYAGPPSGAAAYVRRATTLPGVVAHGAFTGYTESYGTTAVAPVDRDFERTVNVPKLLSGRLPSRTDPLAVAVNFTFANAHHLRVGSNFHLTFTGNQSTAGGAIPTLRLTTHVVGVTATPLQFPPIVLGQGFEILLSRAFVVRFQSKLGPAGTALAVRLRGGAGSVGAYQDALAKAFPNEPELVQPTAPQTAHIRQGIRPEAIGLWALAACLAVVGTLVLLQLFTRESFLEADSYPVLVATGATRAQIVAIDLVRTVVIAVAAAVIALGTAIAASPLFPMGIARIAEPDRGISIDPLVLGLGALLVAVVTIALGARPAWSAARRAVTRRSARDVLGERDLGRTHNERLRLGPVGAVGAAYALRTGRGRAAVPVRAANAALVIAVTGLIAAITLGASLTHLLDTPRLYGWSWDAQIFDLGSSGSQPLMTPLRTDRWISGAAFIDTGIPLSVNGSAVDGLGMHPLKGAVEPVLRSGIAPSGADQIALGSTTMHRLGVGIGDRVKVRITAISNGPTRTMQVVGSAIVPESSEGGDLGRGAVLSAPAFTTLVPKTARDVPPPDAAFVKFAPGQMNARRLAELGRQIGPEYVVLPAAPPPTVTNYGKVHNLPLALALLLALLAIATMATTVVSTSRRRRAELATLKTIGYVPAQIRGVVAWQATTMAVIGCVLGVPFGIAIGRVLSTVIANQLGTVAVTPVPVLLVGLVVVGVVVLANVIAWVPGQLAARGRPATALRSG